ncbi:roundabout homolog 2-like isoform X2 [Eriocheir sinensis]|uniref:roundabout homolog 2-like isoform X2 n=1 Tax=Eriocheir sinensis TaxID=95602 RepID=UPI0021C78537|nr:roundabout homolog 2-like isoform X2 [Eriocheir sinensis]
MVVRRGDPATLNCAAEGEPAPVITWLRDGQTVTTSADDPLSHRVLFPSGSLFFLSTKAGKKDTDSGTYTCTAANVHGAATSRNATLIIATLRDEFRTVPRDVVAASGDRAQLLCSPPRGHPQPQLVWTRNGHPIDFDQEGERLRLREDGTLVIAEVLQTDEGEYVCHATNQAGRRSSPPAILDVLVAPFWVKAPRDVVGVAGERAELSCRVGGDPPPTVVWRRVGGRIPVGRVRVLRDRGLRVAPLRPEDSGVYLCKATNKASEITANASLTVLTAPQVVEVPGDVEVQEGGRLALSCAVEGLPAPLVYWTREGSQTVLPTTRTPLPLGPTHGEDSMEVGGVRAAYEVQHATHHLSGRYVCGGVNRAGGVMTRVWVKVRPAHLLPPPIISVPPANQTLQVGGRAALYCRVWGSPPPAVTWRHRGRPVTPTPRRKILPDNTLTIDEVRAEDVGQYWCVASSPRGTTEAGAFVSLAAPGHPVFPPPDPATAPRPPATPTVRAANETAAVVEWAAPGGEGGVTGYTLEYYSSEVGLGAAWRVAAAHTPHTSFTLAPLRPEATYGVTVRAHNAHGVSEPSGIAEVGVGSAWVVEEGVEVAGGLAAARVVLQEARPVPPRPAAKIVWQTEGDSSGVEGFYIRLHHESRDLHPESSGRDTPALLPPRPAGESNSTVVTVLNAGPGAASYVLHGLHLYRAYTVFLVPFYKTFEGRPSNSLSFFTPEAAPTRPPQSVGVQLTNVTTASVFWSPPPPLHRNGPITAYQLEIVSADGSIFLSRAVNGSVRSLRVHNLTLGDSYHVTLAATTTAGRGPYTAPVSLHVDPVLLHPLAKSGPSLASLDGDVWVIGMIGAAVFCILLVSVATLLLWRRHAKNKALGHSGEGVHKGEVLGSGLTTGDGALWQEYAGWQLEKVCGGSADVKVLNTAGAPGDGEPPAPRSLVTFYRGPDADGPYATTSLLAPHARHSLKARPEEHRVGEGDKLPLGGHSKGGDRTYYTDGANTLRRIKGGRPLLSAPPLPCLPPPGLPESRGGSSCYCGHAPHAPPHPPSRSVSESPYSEAHYTPTLAAHHRPCYLSHAPHGPHCAAHLYSSTTPMPPPMHSEALRPPLSSPATPHHHLCRTSAVYESASLQYAAAGYYLPTSLASSCTSNTSDAASGVSGVSGVSNMERGVQSSLPSLTYEAIRALGEDIQAFRQRHQMADEESHSTKIGGNEGGNGGTSTAPAGGGGGGGGGGASTTTTTTSTTTTTGGNGGGGGGGRDNSGTSDVISKNPNFEVPRPPLSPPSPLSTSLPRKAPQAGTLAPGGSLPPLEIAVAPLEEAESDCLEEEEEEEGGEGDDCSVCSCCEAESSVYAETDFAEEVRASLEEPGGIFV